MDLPRIERTADCWVLGWDEYGIGFGFEKLAESRDGLVAVVTVESKRPGKHGRVLGPVKLNLLSTESQTRFSNALSKRDAELKVWNDLVVIASAIVAKQFMAPSVTVYLDEVEEAPDNEDLIAHLMPLGETTIFYGDAESCKSLLAQRCAVSVQTGAVLPWGGYPSRICPVLYLDWETSEQTLRRRVVRLCAGAEGIEVIPHIAYRGTLSGRTGGFLRTLEDELTSLREQIERERIGLVIVDSIGFAVHGKLVDDDVARSAMQALRYLTPATRLVIAHVSKESAFKSGGRVDPFGSAFFRAGARSAIEVRRAEDDDWGRGRVDLGIWHWKSNDDARQPPFGLRVEFDGRDGPIRFLPESLHNVPDLAMRTTLASRIRHLLARAGRDMDALEIADELGKTEHVVRETLRRMPDSQQVRPGHRGQRATWGLSAGALFHTEN